MEEGAEEGNGGAADGGAGLASRPSGRSAGTAASRLQQQPHQQQQGSSGAACGGREAAAAPAPAPLFSLFLDGAFGGTAGGRQLSLLLDPPGGAGRQLSLALEPALHQPDPELLAGVSQLGWAASLANISSDLQSLFAAWQNDGVSAMPGSLPSFSLQGLTSGPFGFTQARSPR
jgi:hypothetical protein